MPEDGFLLRCSSSTSPVPASASSVPPISACILQKSSPLRAVTNHGLEALEQQQFEQSHKFFGLPEDVKREIMMDENLRCASLHCSSCDVSGADTGGGRAASMLRQ